MRDPAFVGFLLRAWRPLTLRFPFLAGETLVSSRLAPVVGMRASFALLTAEHDANLARNAFYAADLHHRRNGSVVARFNPKSLPPKRAIASLAALDAALTSSHVNVYQPPAPRKLAEIRRHTEYHAHAIRLAAFDAITDAALDARVGRAAKAIRQREQTRHLSCSLPLAGAWKSDPEPVPSPLFLVTAQFSCGLYLSDMVHANAALAARGLQADWLGDNTSSVPSAAGQRTTRHHGLNRAWERAAGDGMAMPVTRCQKGRADQPGQRAVHAAAYADLRTSVTSLTSACAVAHAAAGTLSARSSAMTL
jgi:hypothetical protein